LRGRLGRSRPAAVGGPLDHEVAHLALDHAGRRVAGGRAAARPGSHRSSTHVGHESLVVKGHSESSGCSFAPDRCPPGRVEWLCRRHHSPRSAGTYRCFSQATLIRYRWIRGKALLHLITSRRGEVAMRSGVRSLRQARRTLPPGAGSPAPRPRARSGLVADSARSHARRSRSWRCGPA
jgi:hypothetical protein